jgi:hypothetical protein
VYFPKTREMAGPRDDQRDSVPPVERALDPAMVEVLAHTVFRRLFPEGVRVPIRMSGLIDMDIVVKDNNVLLNVGRVEAELLPLSVWRITVAHRGHPVVEYGRGVRNDAKIHIPRLCFLLLASWAERRRRYKVRARAEWTRNLPLSTFTPGERRRGPVGEPPA